MSKLEDRKANYQAAIDKNVKAMQQLATSVEQLRGAVALCDELLKEEQTKAESTSEPQTETKTES